MNEQQLHMINPYSNELRPEQRSSYTFSLESMLEKKRKKRIVLERREQLNCIPLFFFFFFFTLVMKKGKTSPGEIT